MKFPFLVAIFVFASQGLAEEVTPPRVLDSQLDFSLLASEPEVVTPVGLAADRQGRLYVVETHTHARNSRYEGPRNDRILVYEDTDGDGRLDRHRVHADGLRNALAIAFSRDDNLLACIWGTNQVVRIGTQRRGASIVGDVEPLIVGDENFRPTGIAATSAGTVYIADWADRRYPVHGKGRIWRLAAKTPDGSWSPCLPCARRTWTSSRRDFGNYSTTRIPRFAE